MTEPHATLVITLPTEFFPDGDEGCFVAGKHIAVELGKHLEAHGHTIPDWVKGGCEEDAWVHLESRREKVRFIYTIVFFPRGNENDSMAIQYDVAGNWVEWLRGKKPVLAVDDPIHEAMRQFGAKYKNPECLTRSEFEARY